MVSLATGFLYASPRGKLWAIRNFYRNVWTPAQQNAGVASWMGHGLRAGGHEITNPTTRAYAHATGEWRRAALDELATLIADADPGHERAT